MPHAPCLTQHLVVRLWTLFGGAVQPAGAMPSREAARNMHTLMSFWVVGALPWPIIYMLFYWLALDCREGALICLFTQAFMWSIPLMIRLTRSPTLGVSILLAAMVAGLSSLGLITGGRGAPALNWMGAVPLVSIYLGGLRKGVLWSIAALLVVIVLACLGPAGLGVTSLIDPRRMHILHVVSAPSLMVLIGTLAVVYEMKRREAMAYQDQALEQAEAHSAALARSSQALQISEERLRLALEATTDAIWDWDLVTGDTYYSPRWFTMLGYAPGAISSRYESWEALTPAEDVRQVMAAVEQAKAEGGSFESEYRMRTADGTFRWVRTRGRVSGRDAQGRAIRMSGTNADITDRKRAEEALQASRTELAREAGRAEVATDLLHNVGNVLNSVNVSVHLLHEQLTRSEIGALKQVAELLGQQGDQAGEFLSSDERGRRVPAYLEELAGVLGAEHEAMSQEAAGLAQAVEHMRQVIDMQQVHSNRSTFIEQVDPGAVLEQALGMMGDALERHRITVRRRIQPVGALPLDRHKLLQIVLNLLNNSKRALRESAQDQRLLTLGAALCGSGEAQALQITVSDNGVGIPATDLDTIFQFGFTTSSDGHGFGLHSSANLARELGGALIAASPGLGQGATFTLEMPICQQVCS